MDGIDDGQTASRGTASLPLGPVILRVAAWPVDAVKGLRSPGLAERVDRWLEQVDSVRAAGATLSEDLYPLVPKIADARRRRLMLALRRHVYGTSDPIPPRLLDTLEAPEVPEPVKTAIRHEADRRRRLAAEREALRRAYRVAEAAERTELSGIVRDPAFLKALYLASPSAFASWERAQTGSVDAWPRQLTSTLFGYAMRAVGRATPNGLWAGVALEDAPPATAPDRPPGGEAGSLVRIRPAPARVRFNPDLQPFVTALHAIGTGTPWRPRQPELGFPAIYADAREALRDVLARLPREEVPVWRRVVDRVEQLCVSLDGDPARLSLTDLRRAEEEAARSVGELLERYGLPRLPAEARVLLADLRAPLAFRVSDAVKTRISQALRRYWAFDRYGLGEIEAEVEAWRAFGRVLGDLEMPLPELVGRQRITAAATTTAVAVSDGAGGTRRTSRNAGAHTEASWEARLGSVEDRALRERAAAALQRWRRELEPVHAHSSHRLSLERAERVGRSLPGGAALALIDGTGPTVPIRLGAVAPDPCLFYARFNRLFRTGRLDQDPFATWYQDGLRRLEASCPGLEFADLAVRLESNLNAAARPRLALRRIDAPVAEGGLVRETRLRLGPGRRPVCVLPGGNVTLVPCVHSAATLHGADPGAEALYDIARLVGRPGLMRPLPLFAAEIAAWRHLPRLTIDDDVVISPERWLPLPSIGDELTRHEGFERFIAWRRFVRSARLPALVYGRYGVQGTETLVATDSVLAVEHLGRALAAHGSPFRLQEVFPPVDRWWHRDGEGRRYLTEVAVAWHGDADFWRTYGGMERSGDGSR